MKIRDILGILGILSAAAIIPLVILVAPKEHCYEPVERTAAGDLKMLEMQIDLYARDHDNTYPFTLDDLLVANNRERAYLKESAIDPWGNRYHYVRETTTTPPSFKLFSAGYDGVPGNEDDLTSDSEID